MRGKDLLEKLELADEKYIQAANMPVKKKKTRKFYRIFEKCWAGG